MFGCVPVFAVFGGCFTVVFGSVRLPLLILYCVRLNACSRVRGRATLRTFLLPARGRDGCLSEGFGPFLRGGVLPASEASQECVQHCHTEVCSGAATLPRSAATKAARSARGESEESRQVVRNGAVRGSGKATEGHARDVATSVRLRMGTLMYAWPDACPHIAGKANHSSLANYSLAEIAPSLLSGDQTVFGPWP